MSHPQTIDRFVIVRQVGIGGMGTVYEAIDPHIDRRVALKVLRRDMLAENPELIERLWVEARAANGIRHPGVVQVSEARQLEDGTGYLVMEFLEGPTLTQRLRQQGGRMPVVSALQIAIQMASTLNAGHQKGIVHRDLKPDNVMLVPDDAVAGGERVKLLDFGIAKIIRAASVDAPLTLNDMGLGTPGYMAPEQMRDAASASDRSDVYGLGAVLYELLSGRRPHVAPNAAELIVLVLSNDPPPLTQLVSDAPPALAALLSRMLQREPSSRPPIIEVQRELAAVSAGLSAIAVHQSGNFAAVAAAAVSGPVVPPTIAALASSTPGSYERLGPGPSASTISQMTGQTRLPGMHLGKRRQHWLIVGAALGLGALLWGVLGRSPLPVSNPPIVSAPPQMPVTEPAAPVQAAAPPPLPVPPPVMPPTATPPTVPSPTVPPASVSAPPASGLEHEHPVPIVSEAFKPPSAVSKPVSNRAIIPDASCVAGTGLSLQARRSIATVFSKALVRLLPGEDVYLIRQGDGLEVDSMPQRIGLKQVNDVARMLSTAISKNALPAELKGVHVRCGGK